jgi:zinc transport system substrate-binding protein
MQQRLKGIFGILLILAVAGCEEKIAPTPPPIEQEKLRVLASVYPLADLARQVGGDYVSVEWLAESGQAPPGDIVSSDVHTRARSADFVLSSGEAWAIEGYDDPLRAERVVRLDVLQATVTLPVTSGLVWLDPAAAGEAAEELYNKLASRRPRLQPYFRKRADSFLERLQAVVRQYEPVLTTQPARKAMVVSAEWTRLLARFKIEQVGLVDANPMELSPRQVRQLVETARQHRLTAVFVSADTPAAVIADLQRRTDLTVLTLDPLGTSAGSGRNSYLEVLRYNLDQLHRGASTPPR